MPLAVAQPGLTVLPVAAEPLAEPLPDAADDDDEMIMLLLAA